MSRFIHRTICDVLEEIRQIDKHKNYSYLLGLIEEAQMLGNRMEAGLEEKHDLERYHEKANEAQKKYKKIETEIKTLGTQAADLKNKIKGLKSQRSKLIKDNKGI